MKNSQGRPDHVAIAANIERARLRPALAAVSDWWITFCISGTGAALVNVADALNARNGINLAGAETGFLNAKLRVASDIDQIIGLIDEVDSVVQAAGAELVTVDADSSAEVEQSTFAQLWIV